MRHLGLGEVASTVVGEVEEDIDEAPIIHGADTHSRHVGKR